MVLTGYIDESISKGRRIFTLSALVGPFPEWERLTSDWDRMISAENCRLTSQGRKTIRRYHASECNALANEFAGWTKDEQIALTTQMLCILKRYPLKTVSYSIDMGSLASTFPDSDPIGSAYAISTLWLIWGLGHWLRDKGAAVDVRLTLIHERCDYDEVILGQFNKLIADPGFKHRGYFTTCVPIGWEDCTPLQAADLIAYENMKDYEQKIVSRGRRKTFDLLMTEGNTGVLNYIIGLKALQGMKAFPEVLCLPPKREKRTSMSKKRPSEFKQFSDAMDAILKADPKAVKEAMEREKRENAEKRKSKKTSASGHDVDAND